MNANFHILKDFPSPPQISNAVDVPVRKLEHRLKKLRVKNKIEFRGSPKTGGYWVKESQDSGPAETILGGVNDGVNTLLEFIRKNPGLRTPQISKAMGIPTRTLEKRIKRLKDRGDIEFRGSSRTGGYWEK